MPVVQLWAEFAGKVIFDPVDSSQRRHEARRRQGDERADAGRSGRGGGGDGPLLALRRHPVASRGEVRAQD
jgi:hypothetical protein